MEIDVPLNQTDDIRCSDETFSEITDGLWNEFHFSLNGEMFWHTKGKFRNMM